MKAEPSRSTAVRKAPHNLNAGLVRGRAQNRCPAVHAGVEGDDQDASVALLARQERPIERARHHRPERLTDVAILIQRRAHEFEGSACPLGDPELSVPVKLCLLLVIQRRHRDRARACLPIVHQLRE